MVMTCVWIIFAGIIAFVLWNVLAIWCRYYEWKKPPAKH